MSDTTNAPEPEATAPALPPRPATPARPDYDDYDRPRAPFRRSPFIAGLLSIPVPGLGNIYNGLVQRGLVNFLVAVSLFFAAISVGDRNGGPELALLVPSLIFVWLFSVIDASRQASLINHGVTEADLPLSAVSTRGGGMAVGVALFVIGTYGLLSQVFDLDISFLVDHWYILLMALGAWLVYKARSESRGDDSGGLEGADSDGL